MIRIGWLIVVVLYQLIAIDSSLADDYGRLKIGELKGKLVIEWLEPDVFLFIPDQDQPLKFVRSSGAQIVPGRLVTDGGSIPRPMWAFRSYSPWGYAPAFVIHDWLFHMKKCKIDGYQSYDLSTAGDVLGEIIKTMMETGKVEKDPQTVDIMLLAVKSKFAAKYWTEDDCIPVPPTFSQSPLARYELDFTK